MKRIFLLGPIYTFFLIPPTFCPAPHQPTFMNICPSILCISLLYFSNIFSYSFTVHSLLELVHLNFSYFDCSFSISFFFLFFLFRMPFDAAVSYNE